MTTAVDCDVGVDEGQSERRKGELVISTLEPSDQKVRMRLKEGTGVWL